MILSRLVRCVVTHYPNCLQQRMGHMHWTNNRGWAQDALEEALEQPLMQQLHASLSESHPQASPLARQLQHHILSNLSSLLRCTCL